MERIPMKREAYIAEWMRGSFGRVLEGRAKVKEERLACQQVAHGTGLFGFSIQDSAENV
jgi:hypothetical protein